MNWTYDYQLQKTTAQTAVRAIKSGDRVFVGGNASVPQTLLSALVEYAPNLQDVEICQALSIRPTGLTSPEMAGHLRVNSMFIGADVRKAVQEGQADFTPVLLSEFPLLFKNGFLPLDVALVQISLPDEHGYCSFGVEVGLTKSAAESAKIIIAEVNPQMPRTLGDSFIHISKLNHIVPVDYQIPEIHMADERKSEITDKIAAHIAELIPNGATMQMGIGAIPDAVLKHLYQKRDLGIHSELFSNGVIGLVEAGVVTNAHKTLHTGKIIGGFVLGTQELYHWVDNNPLIELHPTEYVNDPFVIAQNERMVAINSAIEVDLTGQICADSIGTKLYSGVGGQLDFIYGASRSKGGVPVIALPSTATLRDGTCMTRITAMLKPGAGVVTSRNHVRYVVTEYGVADLYGKSIRQRSEQLINIAHPDFRADLIEQAKKLHYQ